jgi:hypothetical protein
LNQVLITLIVLVVASLFTALQRMVHVWRMTGGEAGGWQLPKKPFITPGMAQVPHADSAGNRGGLQTDQPESSDDRRTVRRSMPQRRPGDHNTGDAP